MNSIKDKEGGIKHLSSQILQITIQCKIEWFHMKHPDIVKFCIPLLYLVVNIILDV
jgi:hypothetical protein